MNGGGSGGTGSGMNGGMNGGSSTVVGSITTPINNTVSVRLSRIARKNGLFTINGIGGTDSAAALGATVPSKKQSSPWRLQCPLH